MVCIQHCITGYKQILNSCFSLQKKKKVPNDKIIPNNRRYYNNTVHTIKREV